MAKSILLSIRPECKTEKCLQKLEECSKQNEQWKDVVGYEGLYLVSNLGNVFSVPRYKKHGGILHPQLNEDGYRMQNLTKNNKTKLCKVSRLVAKAFINNENNMPIVNHIDGIKTNDFVNNLEWCSISHNTKEAYRLGLSKPSEKQKRIAQQFVLETKCKKVKAIKNNETYYFNSVSEASKKLNVSISCISRVCNHKRKQTNGYIFEYYNED